ncbi:MAG TPA: response regulator [Candidatus Sulfotelmatobacter sp.]|nr:response regulator [Candidatus Sulfotelmatobacter sp.]
MSESPPSGILVVEDDELVRKFYSRLLAGSGYAPSEARTAKEALAAVRDGPSFAAAIVDGLLPDMHGLVLAQRLLEEPRGQLLPICFVTGAHPPASLPDVGIGILLKPVRGSDLLRQLAELERWKQAPGTSVEERRRALAGLERTFLVGPDRSRREPPPPHR